MWVMSIRTISLRIQNTRFLHTYTFKMNKAYLRHSNGTFDISFNLQSPEYNVNRRFNFSRKLEEPVSTFLSRVVANVEKVVNKKNKKKKQDNTEIEERKVMAYLLQNDSVVDGDILCEELFNINNNVILRLLDKDFHIIINAPYVDAIALPNSILANFPIYPSKFEAVYTRKDLCEFTWFTSQTKSSWNQVGNGFIYTPTNAEINQYLKLMCTPKNTDLEGPEVEVVSDVTIDASPGECPFEHRHMFTKQRCSGET